MKKREMPTKEQLDMFKKANPEMSEEHIMRGINSFNEQHEIIEDAMKEIDRILENASKVALNMKHPMPPFMSFLAKALLERAADFSHASAQALLQRIIDMKKDMNGFFNNLK